MSEPGNALGICGYQWTTGAGPDDPADTGIHRCERTKHGSGEHACACGAGTVTRVDGNVTEREDS